MEKSNEIKKYMEECLNEALSKMINEQTGYTLDTYGMKKRRWIKE